MASTAIATPIVPGSTGRKARSAGAHIKDSAIVMKGRKGLMKVATSGSVRSPLSQQLLDTLLHSDSYVQIPLKGTRTKATTVFNLREKAKRLSVDLHWTLSPDEKSVYAWYTKKKIEGNGSSAPSSKEIN